MSEIILDPGEEFLSNDPTVLKDPLLLTPSETKQIEQVASGASRGVKVAVGLGAAYLVYRQVMSRRMREETRKMGPDASPSALMSAASAVWNAFVPKWVSMTAPYFTVGYIEGVRASRSGEVPPQYLARVAKSYAKELGDHINEVSADAMVSGFQAQVNRKVPRAMASRRVADAYGITRRGMNTLVNVWTAEEAKKYTDKEIPSVKEDRAKYFIEAQNKLRARQVGDNEAWTAHTQGKQMVWMYGVDKGVLPRNARRVWITAADEKVCPSCGPMDGKSAPVGRKFSTASGSVWTPPLHVNCRCDVVLDLTSHVDIQAELTQLLEEESSVTKAAPGDPFDRDNKGRFAAQEARKFVPVQRPVELTQADRNKLRQERKAKEAKPKDLFAPKSNDLFRGEKKDLLRGRGKDLLAGREGDLLAGEALPTRDISAKDPLKGSRDLFTTADPIAAARAFQQTDLFKRRQEGFFNKIDVLASRPRPPLRPVRDWERYHVPLIALLEPKFASDYLYDDDDDFDNATSYEDMSMGMEDYEVVDVKPSTRFFEWHPYDSGPDKYEHPVMKHLNVYWLKVISKEVTAYERMGEDNWARIKGSDNQSYIVDPKAYGAVLASLVFDSNTGDDAYTSNSHVWLTPEGYEVEPWKGADVVHQMPWETAGVAEKLIRQGHNPWDWIDTHTPTLMITDWVNTMEAVHHPNAGSFAGWEMGAFENPGRFDIESLHEDWAEDFMDPDGHYDGTAEGGKRDRANQMSHLPVVIAQGTPHVLAGESGERDLDQEMHRGDNPWEIWGDDK